jgi:phosphoadenosine phosphosulfate reductase
MTLAAATDSPSTTGAAMTTTGVPDLRELAEVSRSFESKPASAAIAWAYDHFGDGLVLAASFQDCVLIDIVAKTVPAVDVVFLDTQYHFAETLWYVEHVRNRYDLRLHVEKPRTDLDDLWHRDPDACCRIRKVEPLERALSGRSAWMSGVRRDETAARARTQVVSYDVGRGLVKVNPLATWTDADVAGYVKDHDLPVHPLADRGYASIGCWPCTRPVADGEDARAGRWAGMDKTECGLHG